MLIKLYYLRHPYHLCTDILVIWGFTVYILLNSSFSLKPIPISMFHHANPSKTHNGDLCKNTTKSCRENFILVCISPLLYLKLRNLVGWNEKWAALRCALYREYFFCYMEHCTADTTICCYPLYTKQYGVNKTLSLSPASSNMMCPQQCRKTKCCYVV